MLGNVRAREEDPQEVWAARLPTAGGLKDSEAIIIAVGVRVGVAVGWDVPVAVGVGRESSERQPADEAGREGAAVLAVMTPIAAVIAMPAVVAAMAPIEPVAAIVPAMSAVEPVAAMPTEAPMASKAAVSTVMAEVLRRGGSCTRQRRRGKGETCKAADQQGLGVFDAHHRCVSRSKRCKPSEASIKGSRSALD